MPIRKLLAVTALLLILLLPANTLGGAQTPEPEGYPVYIYLFWGEGCPHCAAAKPYFESLTRKYSHVIYRDYEIYQNECSSCLVGC